MVSIRKLAVAASSFICLVSAAPTEIASGKAWVPGAQNNTREFYVRMQVTSGQMKYNGWHVETYHTGAGLADPVFVSGAGSRAFLNGTHLQFDVDAYPFSLEALPSDTNYARWEPTSISSGYGTGVFVNNGPDGIKVDNEEFGGWLVCEWFHGIDAPQLFQLIKGFDDEPHTIPSSCANVLLFPVYI